MKFRLLSLVSILIISVSGYLGIEALESKLESDYSKSVIIPEPIFDNTELLNFNSKLQTTTSYDPVIPSDDSRVWDREVEYLQKQNIMRYSWGPDMRAQIGHPYSIDDKIILVVGDSFVWGQSVEDTDMRWDRRLEHELNKLGNDRYRVVSLARIGTSTMNQSEWFTEERLQRIRPDAIVVGFVGNDYSPTYSENKYCHQFDICLSEGEPLSVGNPRNKALIKCLLGNESAFGGLLRNYVMPRWPNIGRWMVARWCDPDRVESVEYKDLYSQGRSISDPMSESSWPYFIESINLMKRAAGTTPIFLADTSNNTREGSNSPGVKAFEAAGFEIIDMDNIKEVLNKYPKDQMEINPSDNHPGAILTYAYARNAAKSILDKFGSNTIGEASDGKREHELVSNYLPTYLILDSPEKGSTSIVSPGLSHKQKYYNGLEYNRNKSDSLLMTAPCGSMGRPHARVMLDPKITSGIKIRLNLTLASETLVVQPLGYSVDGVSIFDKSFILNMGEIANYSIGEGITGFLIGGVTSGCESSEKQLPIFKLSISR
jgi:hypothetical protein